jgi:peptidoglycan/LPS O-acetylase OafA/YrhL
MTLKVEQPVPYRPDIDGLRALAVIGVVLYHTFPTGVVRGGFVGVDVFFVISGYLISSIILSDAWRGNFSFINFYKRRVLRLFPALIVVLSACLIAGWFLLLADEYCQLGKHVSAGTAFIANLIFWQEAGYFDTASETKPLLHLWSLGVEEQFYLIAPAILVLMVRTETIIRHWILALLFASLISCIYFSNTEKESAFYLPYNRFWELLCGALLALPRVKNMSFRYFGDDVRSVLGLTLILASAFVLQRKLSFPGAWALLPVAGAFLLISAGEKGFMNRLVLSNRLMVAIGLVSYPLYLWHWPLLAFLRIGASSGGRVEAMFASRVAAMSVSVFLAFLTYKAIELPIRTGGRKVLYSIASIFCIGTLGAIGFAIYSLGGIEARIDVSPKNALVLFSEYPHQQRNSLCQTHYPSLDFAFFCELSKPEPATLALIGDSHANQYFQSLVKRLPDVSVLNFGLSNCLPFSSPSRSSCRQQSLDRTIQFIKDNPSISTYIIAGYYSKLASGLKENIVEGANDLIETDRRAFTAEAQKLLSNLTDLHKSLIFLLDIPDLGFRPRDCVTFHSFTMTAFRGGIRARNIDNCGVAVDEFHNRMAAHDAMIADIIAQYQDIHIFDPRKLICDEKLCRAFKDGGFIYWNADHLTVKGADMIVDELIKTDFLAKFQEPN